ncbi:hypothetical protein [Capnocytophaga felis]|uniref:Uncharacterized protein n=1 Tax=Capnocytophaga felis TaxID=2267611 RepID=A0A5M4BC23_9FLAO|nr:hypothetical protein [Capnocytophaga felis]GET46902.1 hypothetical protein RCZ01_22040 [Capnocytophaga felis]GET49632.1 hypothetical protein RCZ02_24630 [Capnocytophaga felis]
MEKALKVFIVYDLPLIGREAFDYVNQFIEENKDNPMFYHLFEDESEKYSRVSQHLQETGKISRPCSLYVYDSISKNPSILVSDEKGVCKLIGSTENLLRHNFDFLNPTVRSMTHAIAESKSSLRFRNNGHGDLGIDKILSVNIIGYYDESRNFINKHIIPQGYWQYDKATGLFTFPENQYVEVGKEYNVVFEYTPTTISELDELRDYINL